MNNFNKPKSLLFKEIKKWASVLSEKASKSKVTNTIDRSAQSTNEMLRISKTILPVLEKMRKFGEGTIKKDAVVRASMVKLVRDLFWE